MNRMDPAQLAVLLLLWAATVIVAFIVGYIIH